MLFTRSLIYFIGFVIVIIVITIISLPFAFSKIKLRYRIITQCACFSVWWLKVICNLKMQVIGKENIPQKPCVVMSNHNSTWETFGLQLVLPMQTWVLKRELLFIPFFGWALALLKPIIIDRGNKIKAIRKVAKQGSKRIKDGIFVIIFPEGTRQRYNQLGKYKNGGVAIAKQANVDILPIYHNAGKYWEKGSFIKHPGTIVVVIGKPIVIDNRKPNDVSDEIKQWTLMQAQHHQ